MLLPGWLRTHSLVSSDHALAAHIQPINQHNHPALFSPACNKPWDYPPFTADICIFPNKPHKLFAKSILKCLLRSPWIEALLYVRLVTPPSYKFTEDVSIVQASDENIQQYPAPSINSTCYHQSIVTSSHC